MARPLKFFGAIRGKNHALNYEGGLEPPTSTFKVHIAIASWQLYNLIGLVEMMDNFYVYVVLVVITRCAKMRRKKI